MGRGGGRRREVEEKTTAQVKLPTHIIQLLSVGVPGGSMVKYMPDKQEMWVQPLGQEDPLEKEMATHSSILFWRILCTEEPGGIQSIGSQKSQTRLSDPTTTIYLPILPPCSTF